MRSLFLWVCGIFGIPKAVQKSSANWPQRYPWRVSGADSPVFTFSFPLSEPPSVCFNLHTKVFDRVAPGVLCAWGVLCGVVCVGDWSCGKLTSLGCRFVYVIVGDVGSMWICSKSINVATGSATSSLPVICGVGESIWTWDICSVVVAWFCTSIGSFCVEVSASVCTLLSICICGGSAAVGFLFQVILCLSLL